MKAFTALFALAAVTLAAASPAARSTLVINTPAGATECQPTLLEWSGGEPPYFLTVQSTKGSHVYLHDDNTDYTSLTWFVNVPAGKVVSAQVKDSTGAVAYTASFTIAKGSSSNCL